MSDVVSTSGSLIKRMIDGMKLSEAKRAAALRRGDSVRARAEEELAMRADARGASFDPRDAGFTAGWTADHDPVVQAAVAGEQWGSRLTTMYGVAAMAVTVTDMQPTLERVASQQKQIIALLERIAVALESRASA